VGGKETSSVNIIMALLFRCVVALGGYIVACLCASAFLNIAILGSAGFTAEEMPIVASGSLIFSIPFVSLFVAYFAFIPSVAAIAIGELLGKRDWLYYALTGGVVAVIIVGFIRKAADPNNAEAFDLTLALVMLGAGMCGGIGYWLVAGRSAGSWRQPRRDVTSSAP